MLTFTGADGDGFGVEGPDVFESGASPDKDDTFGSEGGAGVAPTGGGAVEVVIAWLV
jgi:hypothetical protein